MQQKTTFLYILALIFLFPCLSSLAEEPSLYNKGPIENIRSRYTAKKMSTMSFDTPELEKKEAPKEAPEAPEKKKEEEKERALAPAKEKFKTVDDIPEDQRTEGQKLFQKYKELAEKREAENAKEQKEEPSEEGLADAGESEAENVEEPEPADIQPANGLSAILQEYKNSKSSKNPINTRSFGPID